MISRMKMNLLSRGAAHLHQWLPVSPVPTPGSRRGSRTSLLPPGQTWGQYIHPTETIQAVYDLGIKRGLQKGKMTWPRRAMIFYRTRQSWLPRKLFSLEPGKLVLCICNDQQLACYPSLPRCHPHRHPHPPLPRRPAQRNILNLRRKTGRCLVCLSGLRYVSVWALCFLIILLKFWVLISMVSRQGSPSKSNCWKYKKTLT